jgi:succinate dehydrogenase / fumarate reductase, membrane anchor subunit
MVSPRQRQAVGAHYGVGDWLAQRVTAVVMALYTLLFLALVLYHGGMSYETWKALFANGPFRIASFLFMAALLYHAWVGVRNISMDYVKPLGVRIALQSIVIALAVAYAGWTIQILWSR